MIGRYRNVGTGVYPLVVMMLGVVLLAGTAVGMSMIAFGNKPVGDANWPMGALEVANLKTRVATVSHETSGQTHFIYRGDTDAFQMALDNFAKIRAPALHLMIHEGPHFDEALKETMDWTFLVTNAERWHREFDNPLGPHFIPEPEAARAGVPPPTMEVYVRAAGAAEGIEWSNVKVPAEVKLVDRRAVSAGYKPDDGSVIRGDVYDMLTSKPIAGAHLVAGKIDRQIGKIVQQTKADVGAGGHFEVKGLGEGYYDLDISAAGYVPRRLRELNVGKHELSQNVVELTVEAGVAGSVRDKSGKALSGVKVHAVGTMGLDGHSYDLIEEIATTTDETGHFALSGMPRGYLLLYTTKTNYQQRDSSRLYAAPSDEVGLVMEETHE